MRAVIQRVSEASVRWDGGESSIGPGYCILLGVAETDAERDAGYLADKILRLRVFSDEAGKFNLSAIQVKAAFLVVSQFTLFADARGQNRPSFLHAARPEQGIALLDRFTARLRESGLPVQTRFLRHPDGGAIGQRRPGHDRPEHRRVGPQDRLTRQAAAIHTKYGR